MDPMFLHRSIVAAASAFIAGIAQAQTAGTFVQHQQLQAAQLNAALAAKQDYPIPSSAIDAAFGSTRGSLLERGAAGWQTVVPGTAGLPWVSGGPGADPVYQALTAAGIAAGTITNANLASMAAGTVKGSIAGGTPGDLTATQLTTLCNTFTSSLSGCAPASGGGTTNFLRADGTWAAPAGGALGAVTVQTFTSGSGTYTPTSGTRRVRVRMIGGGGGGSAITTNNGTAGGTTTFGSWTAGGGAGGVPGTVNPANGGSGGANGTGTLIVRFAGSAGMSGTCQSVTPFGGGACGWTANVVPSAPPANSGAGGAGSYNGTSFGNGGASGEYVEFWVQSPASTAYAVGTAGSGGTAGTVAGGPGAAGIIIVEEYPFHHDDRLLVRAMFGAVKAGAANDNEIFDGLPMVAGW